MSLDELLREAIGWPLPRPAGSPAEIVADLRGMLADRRRAEDRRAGVQVMDALHEQVRQAADRGRPQ